MIHNLEVELKTVKVRVEYLLDYFPESRNNDFYLTWLYLKFFEGLNLPYLPFSEFKRIKSLESICRVRRKIQNEDRRFLPNDIVVRARREKSRAYRKVINRI